MATIQLTSTQERVLLALGQNPHDPTYVGSNYVTATVGDLIRKGLVSVFNNSHGWVCVALTDTGQRAYAQIISEAF